MFYKISHKLRAHGTLLDDTMLICHIYSENSRFYVGIAEANGEVLWKIILNQSKLLKALLI